MPESLIFIARSIDDYNPARRNWARRAIPVHGTVPANHNRTIDDGSAVMAPVRLTEASKWCTLRGLTWLRGFCPPARFEYLDELLKLLQ
jgi:hypothetical protein